MLNDASHRRIPKSGDAACCATGGRLATLAKLERVRGRGGHSLRRKFATDLKHTPMADLQSLGGWRDHNTILKCYIRPDELTMRGALEKRPERRAAGARRATDIGPDTRRASAAKTKRRRAW